MPMIDQIRKVVANVLEVPETEITAESNRDSLSQWDSLRHLDVIMEVEAAFGTTFTLEEAVSMASVRDLTRTVAEKLAR